MAKNILKKFTRLASWLIWEKNDLKNDFYLYPKRRFLVGVLMVSFLFWGIYRLWLATFSRAVIVMDQRAIELISTFKNPALDSFFSLLTFLGSGYFIGFCSLVLAFWLIRQRRKRAAFIAFSTLFGVGLLIFVFREIIFGRPRPSGCIPSALGQSCFSFPSGHATISFYFYGLLFSLITRFTRLKVKTAAIMGLGFSGLVLLVAFSRVYLGYHFLSDIIGGFFLGGIFVLVSAILIDFLYQK